MLHERNLCDIAHILKLMHLRKNSEKISLLKVTEKAEISV